MDAFVELSRTRGATPRLGACSDPIDPLPPTASDLLQLAPHPGTYSNPCGYCFLRVPKATSGSVGNILSDVGFALTAAVKHKSPSAHS
jgi:hypothetical protein